MSAHSTFRDICLAGLLAVPAGVRGQSFTLSMAEERARRHFPALRQQALARQARDITASNLMKGYLPQVSLGGQASYQSDVTQLVIPNAPFKVEPLSKDQYRLTVDVAQTLFDGGWTRAQLGIAEVQSQLEEGRAEVDLHRLRQQVQALYFGILLSDAMAAQTDVLKADIDEGIRKVSAQVEGGMAFRSSLDALKAEALRAEQRRIEVAASRRGLMEALGVLADTVLGEGVRFEMPPSPASGTQGIQRPELELFRLQSLMGERQKSLTDARLRPRTSLFLTGGYGRPGLNMLKNSFEPYGIGGLRFQWNLGARYTAHGEKALADIGIRNAGLQAEAFRLQTESQARQQRSDIDRLTRLTEADRSIIALRSSVKQAALAQLEAGVATVADYLREVNAEDMARQTLRLHELQLVQSRVALAWTLGSNSPTPDHPSIK
jgi:outer membrane protein TolC